MFSMNNILARAFYALNDIKTPMQISVICLALNLAFSFWLVQPYREAGLGVANTLSASLNAVLLVHALRRKLSRLGLASLQRTLLVLLPAAAFAGILAWFLGDAWEKNLGHATLALKIGAFFIPAGAAGLFYYAVAWYAKIPAARETIDLVLRRLRK
jgi:putative peptidoglycan lipid II flippase